MSALLKALRVAAYIVVPIAASGSVFAQETTADALTYPTKPIRWIVPYPPGGPADVVARVMAERLSPRVKQAVLVENRGGGFGSVGAELAVRAPPDGHTIYMGSSTEIINRALGKGTVDPLADLKPVAQLVRITFVLISNPNFQPRTVAEVLAAAKASPGAITCGWGAPILRIGCELLRTQGGVDIGLIPYQGAAPALRDLMGGQIALTFSATNTALPAVKGNRAVAIATANISRGSGPFGELPTVAETLPGFALESWFGVFVPNATPTEIVSWLNQQLEAVLQDEEVRKLLTAGGLEVTHASPEVFAELMRRDYAKYSKIIAAAGIKAD